MTEAAQKIVDGDLRALARAATWIENRSPEAEPLLRELFPHTGQALIIGVTGPPGAGKSTLCDQCARLIRKEGKTVGVIAVDPSSPYSGGAVLGDRIRMQDHYSDPGVFIRSMATRGCLGGLARATTEMTMLLDAAGRDVVLVETVGVGQDEVEIVNTVALEGKGVADVLAAARRAEPRGRSVERSAEIWAARLREMLRDRLLDRFSAEAFLSAGREVASHQRDPYTIVHEWLKN